MMELFSTLFNSVIEKPKKLEEPEYIHCDGVIIRNIKIHKHHTCKVSFVEETRVFWYSGLLEPEKYISRKVNIIYKPVLSDTYLYFWIKSIELKQEDSSAVRRHSIDKPDSELIIPCNNCGKEIPF